MDTEQSRTLPLKIGLGVVLFAVAAVLVIKGYWRAFFFYLAGAGVLMAGVAEYEPGTSPEDLRKLVKKWAIISLFFFAAVFMYTWGWMTVLTAYIVIVAFLAVVAILLQSGRGGGLAASFGGVGGDSLLGARSATPIAKATYVMLALFVFNAVLIAHMNTNREPTQPLGEEQTQSVPANAPAE